MHEAIILAGGFGTRLKSVVSDLPKPLAPVAGRPFLAWILDALADQSFSRVIVSVGYLHEQIIETLGYSWRDMVLSYAIESEPLGTGGAIRYAARQTASQTLCVLNGDTFVELDYNVMFAAHTAAEASITIAAVAVSDIGRFGELAIAGGRVVGFSEKGGSGPGRINGGIYCINRSLFDDVGLPNRFSFETDVLSLHLARLNPLAYKVNGLFIDMGIPEDYARAQGLFSR